MLDPIRSGIERYSVAAASASVRVIAGTLGDRAEVLGAAGLISRVPLRRSRAWPSGSGSISDRDTRVTRVAVVGAGVMGCAAAWALTARGADVTVHEQFDLDHDRGSSHGRSRIVRLAYPEVEWVRFAREAMDAWRELEEESGEALLDLQRLVELVSEPLR